MSFLSLLLFIVLQIVFIPLAVLGIVLVAYRQLAVSRKLGISQTAIEVLNGRWTMHIFGIRGDDATARLATVLPNTSLAGLWLTLFPLWAKYKMTGKLFLYPRVPEPGTEGLGDLMVARTLYFDQVIKRVVGNVEQFVVLGAGYDTRAYGRYDNVKFFEVDQVDVQNHKREVLASANVPSDHVRFVSVDFSRDNLFEKLKEAGYDSSSPSLFLWEGVTLYLSEADVRKTLRDVRENSAPHSVLLADIYADRLVRIGKDRAAKKVLEITDEGLTFGLPFEEDHEGVLATFVESESLTVGETFFMGKTNDKGPFMVVAELLSRA